MTQLSDDSRLLLKKIENHLRDIGVDYPEYYEERARIIQSLLGLIDAQAETLGMADAVGMGDPYAKIVRECLAHKTEVLKGLAL